MMLDLEEGVAAEFEACSRAPDGVNIERRVLSFVRDLGQRGGGPSLDDAGSVFLRADRALTKRGRAAACQRRWLAKHVVTDEERARDNESSRARYRARMADPQTRELLRQQSSVRYRKRMSTKAGRGKLSKQKRAYYQKLKLARAGSNKS